MSRDVVQFQSLREPPNTVGRSVVAAIGIDRYMAWPRLQNAAGDASGALRLFEGLGFTPLSDPLIDRAATGSAMQRLVNDDLARLSPDDRLVLFFAGHGHTQIAKFPDTTIRTGYLIPSDADPVGGRVATWVRIDNWLSDIARLPPRHILVIIDACRSGISLGALVKWRDSSSPRHHSLHDLDARRSRRVITSALDSQSAMDSGPVPGHSLFTGCLIEAFSGGLTAGRRRVATGSELGMYLQRRVSSYPASTQTPDFGVFELDDRGELLLPVAMSAPLPEQDLSGGLGIRAPAPLRGDRKRFVLAAVTLAGAGLGGWGIAQPNRNDATASSNSTIAKNGPRMASDARFANSPPETAPQPARNHTPIILQAVHESAPVPGGQGKSTGWPLVEECTLDVRALLYSCILKNTGVDAHYTLSMHTRYVAGPYQPRIEYDGDCSLDVSLALNATAVIGAGEVQVFGGSIPSCRWPLINTMRVSLVTTVAFALSRSISKQYECSKAISSADFALETIRLPCTAR